MNAHQTTIGLQDYNIYLGDCFSTLANFITTSNYSKIWVLVDENTATHCLPLIQEKIAALSSQTSIIQIKSGEIYKTLDTCQFIWKRMLEEGTDRKALMINLGGGVVGDMGGFCASTYKRGIDFIQIPTTLLAQVDASIGGKLGVDFEHVKNIIGCFNNPQAVFIDPIFLKTLPNRQLHNGFAEVIKHALIADENYWQELLKIEDLKNVDWHEIIYKSLLVKKQIVEKDPFEQGLRKVLNFGHTIGHAIESWSLENDKAPLLHGEAIALGMEAELLLSTQLSDVDIQTSITFIKQFYAPYQCAIGNDYSPLMAYMKNDKKNEGSQVNFSLLQSIGKAIFNQEMEQKTVIKVLNKVLHPQ